MYQVAVLPPPEALGDVEGFRNLHDPTFHRIAAHIPLLLPFEPVRADLLECFDAFDGTPFRARLGDPVVTETSVSLSLAEGGEQCADLRSALGNALLDPAADRPEGPPLLRIGLFSSPAELELARRTLNALDGLDPFEVTQLTLLLEDVRGIWHPIRQRELTAD